MKAYHLFVAVLPVIFATACVKDVNPSVFEVSPNVIKYDAATGHDVTLTLKCDKPYEAKMAKGEWASVTSTGESSGTEHKIVVSMEINDTGASRSDNLIVNSGNLTMTVSISQSGVITLVDKTSTSLNLMEEGTLTISPGASTWSIQQVTTKTPTTDWLSLDKTSGDARVVTKVTLKAKSINLGEEPREALLKVMTGTEYVYVTVTQPSSVPGNGFSEAGYGIYNYDGSASSFSYDRLAHQLNVLSGTNRKFRIVAPHLEKIVEWSSLPSTWSTGSEVTLQLYQNVTTALSSSSEISATVYKTDDEKVWLVDNDGVGYIVKK